MQPSRYAPPAAAVLAVAIAAVLFGIVGCGARANPATWSETDIETNLREKLDWPELDLQPAADGGYTGEYRDTSGETYDVTVTQDPEAKRLDYHVQSDRGFVEDGFYEVD